MMLELPIVRVQVQRDRMKTGLPPNRVYGPQILHEVAALRVDADGVVGIEADGTELMDVHNVNHERTRNSKGRNGISIMTTGDYVALRETYGPHLTDGIAGESILVDYAPGLARRLMPEELSVAGEDVIPDSADPLALTGVHVAKPCVAFTRFCLRRTDFDVDDDIKQTLADLDDGARGYKMTAARSATIRPGDMLVVDLP